MKSSALRWVLVSDPLAVVTGDSRIHSLTFISVVSPLYCICFYACIAVLMFYRRHGEMCGALEGCGGDDFLSWLR